MNAYGSTGLFGMLVATSLVSGATAHGDQSAARSIHGERAGFHVPAFLDVARLPDMQEAWRARFSDAASVERPPAR